MDGNILYYVAAVLDPRIKISVIRAQMKEEDSNVIVAQVREFLKQYPAAELSPSGRWSVRYARTTMEDPQNGAPRAVNYGFGYQPIFGFDASDLVPYILKLLVREPFCRLSRRLKTRVERIREFFVCDIAFII